MADVVVNAINFAESNEFVEVTDKSFSANDKVMLEYGGRAPIIEVTATTAGNVTFSKGSFGQKDLVVALKAGVRTVVQLDGSYFKNGGDVVMTPAVAGKVAVINPM